MRGAFSGRILSCAVIAGTLVIIVRTVFGDAGVRVNHGGGSECVSCCGPSPANSWTVTNNHATKDIFVPNATMPEMQAFIDHSPANVNIVSGCCQRPGPGDDWTMDDGVSGPYHGSSPCSHGTLNVKICITDDMETPPAVTGYRLYLSENGGPETAVKTWGYPAGSSCYIRTWTKPYDLVFRAVAYNACGESCAGYRWEYHMNADCTSMSFPEQHTTGLCP